LSQSTPTLLIGLIAVTLGATPVTVHAGPRDVAAIKALENRFTAAFNAKDVDAIMKVYVPNDSLVVFDVVPPRQFVGAAAYRKDWENFLATLKTVKCEVSDLDVTADASLGFSHSIQHVTGTDTKDKPFDLTVRVTDAYRKTSRGWVIVHEHVSVPVDLDTQKADLSSKP
jgi:ketosteroid isomerase-like protein